MALRVDGRVHPSRDRIFPKGVLSGLRKEHRAGRLRLYELVEWRTFGFVFRTADLALSRGRVAALDGSLLTAGLPGVTPARESAGWAEWVHGDTTVRVFPHSDRHPFGNEKCCTFASCYPSAPKAWIGRGAMRERRRRRTLPSSGKGLSSRRVAFESLVIGEFASRLSQARPCGGSNHQAEEGSATRVRRG